MVLRDSSSIYFFNCPYRLERRRRTIDALDGFRLSRVGPPLAGLPDGLTG